MASAILQVVEPTVTLPFECATAVPPVRAMPRTLAIGHLRRSADLAGRLTRGSALLPTADCPRSAHAAPPRLFRAAAAALSAAPDRPTSPPPRRCPVAASR